MKIIVCNEGQVSNTYDALLMQQNFDISVLFQKIIDSQN